MKSTLFTLSLALTLACPAAADLRLSRLIGDGMVLQRDVSVPIWGWAEAGTQVTVTFDGETHAAQADAAGRWSVSLPARGAGGPHKMTIAGGGQSFEIGDVLVGDVWLCSGQSNMEFPVSRAFEFPAEAAAATDRKIRHFQVPKSWAGRPEEELAGGEWVVTTPETVGDFTAVGYFFARELRRHVDVPIGLIHSSWGGSRIEPWMSAASLGLGGEEQAFEAVARQMKEETAKRLEDLREKIGDLPEEDQGMDGDRPLWADPALDDSGWERMSLPGRWEELGYPGLDGIVWFRRTLSLTAEEAAAAVEIGLGKIDDGDVTWINGQRIGGLAMSWETPRVYALPAGTLHAGENVIAVRVEDTGGGGGMYGPADGMYLDLGGQRRPLDGEWLFRVGAFRFDPSNNANQFPTLLYNKMIHPMLSYPIKGALWYQGESNTGPDDAYEYRSLFATLIEDWRKLWGVGDFPFLFVQLANYLAPVEEPSESNWAMVRESQSAALELPNTAQAVIIDIGEADDVHPRDKQDVGLRLSLAARHVAYGEKDIVFSGPTYREHEVRDGKVWLSFDHVGGGLVARGGELREFAIAGADLHFVWAQAKIEGEKIVVWSEDVPEPVAVRYAWADNPDGANLYNAEDLPASPFRTDGAGPRASDPPYRRHEDGVELRLGDRHLRLRVCSERVIRVLDAPNPDFFGRDTLMIDGSPCRDVPWKVDRGDGTVTLSTTNAGGDALLRARVDLGDGRVTFLDPEDKVLLAEEPGGRTLEKAEVQGEKTFHVRARFEPSEGEAFYGLGQHQSGLMNYRGHDVDLFQANIVASVPFLVSSRGWGLLWDNTSRTRFGDLRWPEPIRPERLYDAEGRPGGLTGTYRQGSCTAPVVATRVDAGIAFGAPEDRPAVSAVHQAPQPTSSEVHPALQDGDACVTWEGQVSSVVTGDHDFVVFGNNGIRVWIGGELVIDSWRQGWLPWNDVARVSLVQGQRVPIRIEWRRDEGQGTLRLKWKTPSSDPATSLWSEVGDGIDYYFVYGPDLDAVVSGYRELTGRAPLMPRWAFGLWQSRERYETAQQSLDVVAEFRRRKIPFDNIVQDWRYWEDDQWGSHRFDPERFPDPAGWIRALHELHARLMISVWPKFYRGTDNFNELNEAGFLYQETLKRPTTDWLGYVHTFYDAFNPDARRLFWDQMNRELFTKGVDAWWMDATEPEMIGEGTPEALQATMNPTALGSGARMMNAFALVNSEAVYEGQRRAAPDQRVFILTRSAFAGIQRYSSATWSGDVSSSWGAFAHQVPAGLNFTLSGIPYWTTDVGGFAVPRKFAREDPSPEDLEDWRELVTRWFQFATFCPLLRVHGQYPHREMWYFGGDEHPAYQSQLAFDRLRYRLLPYVYSLAGRVTHGNDTMMRALVMDFADDPKVLDIGDQFMFGPAFLVNPVTSPGARSRPVYLPSGTRWYDFWTGQALAGGREIEAPAPYERLPLYIRAGSIVPFGPDLQYTDEKPADPLVLWVYQGADGEFELYEDAGVDNGYEDGAFATIPLRWQEEERELVLGERKGSFPGMLSERDVQVVFVSASEPLGYTPEPRVTQKVRYTGSEVVVSADSSE